MKKILLYTDTPQIGGAELQIFLLAKFLNKEQFTPILACSNYPQLDNWTKKFTREGIQVIRINVKHKHDPRHYFQLKKIIKQHQIDLLHSHVWNPASCRYSYQAAKSSKIPMIITEHDPFKLTPLKHFFKNRALNTVKKIITVSQKNAELLKNIHPTQNHKIQTINAAIDITWWQSQILSFNQNEKNEIKEQTFKAKSDSLILISIGELHERKNHQLLLHSLPEVVKNYSNVKCVIVGQGKERENLEKLTKKLQLQNHITFTGFQKDIPKLLKSSDIFILPSKREAFGLVNTEAMISGLPVIAKNVGGVSEIITNNQNGYLIDTQSQLTEKIQTLIAHPSLRSKFSHNNIQKVKTQFSAKEMAKKHQSIYSEILN